MAISQLLAVSYIFKKINLEFSVYIFSAVNLPCVGVVITVHCTNCSFKKMEHRKKKLFIYYKTKQQLVFLLALFLTNSKLAGSEYFIVFNPMFMSWFIFYDYFLGLVYLRLMYHRCSNKLCTKIDLSLVFVPVYADHTHVFSDSTALAMADNKSTVHRTQHDCSCQSLS